MATQKKRLVFNFDGTWNRLDAVCPTNVVLTAESVLPLDSEGVAQVNYYHQGVGTGRWDHFRGGVFGIGLTDNLADAYRYLIFNYTPGDDIFVFGFSRGAFTARSFVGLLRNCGILARCHADRVGQAIGLYRSRDPNSAPWGARAEEFRNAYVPDPIPEIAYLGVWDTVGALGMPNYYGIAHLFNRGFQFHDTDLSNKVRSARHAVAIDETRRDFVPSLWSGFDEMNQAAKMSPTAPDAPYQQKWFPGVHCAVGGGGDYRGLSDEALEWVWAGARLAGLALDTSPSSRVYSLQPDFMAPLGSQDFAKLAGFVHLKARIKEHLWFRAPREHGPASVHHVSIAARRRWHAAADALPEHEAYRPPPLNAVAAALAEDPEYANPAPLPAPGTFEIVVVARGDSLSKIARDRLGDLKRWPEIFAMNRDRLADPDRIYCGMTLRIPRA